ncbi:hypothetical protein RYZ20_01395 [Thioclava sp. A2]|nr:hypothetical protein [Thioclava sp. A2]MDV7269549.1 hypothetical protein [Thioclava sp. A2]
MAGELQATIFCDALARRPSVRGGIVPAELLQLVSFGADVLIVFCIPREVRLSDQKHSDQQLGIDRWAAGVTVEINKVGTDTAQLDKTVNGSQQVAILQRELENSAGYGSCLGPELLASAAFLTPAT